MSFIDITKENVNLVLTLPIFASSILKEVQDLANLKILSILSDLSAEMAPPVSVTPAHAMIFSAVESSTIKQSNKLKVSFI